MLSAMRLSSASGQTSVPRWTSENWTMRKPSNPAGIRSEQTSVRLTRICVLPRVVPQIRSGHADAGGDAGVRQADEPEEIAGDARQDGDHPYPERPHGEEHESRGVVAAQGVGQGDDRRQGVGGGGQRDEQAQVACGGSAPPQPAVVYDVCGCGRERQNRNKPEKHTLF